MLLLQSFMCIFRFKISNCLTEIYFDDYEVNVLAVQTGPQDGAIASVNVQAKALWRPD